MQLPPISPRRDGLVLNGYCGACSTAACQLIVSMLPDGRLRLAYHGTATHSIVLSAAQRRALTVLLNTPHAEGGEDCVP